MTRCWLPSDSPPRCFGLKSLPRQCKVRLNLVADEGVDRPVVERLRQEGHHVIYVAELSLLTADKDFGELVFRQGFVRSGVVLVRLAGLANATKADIVAEVRRARTAELSGAFSVVSPGQVRIRRRS